MINQEINNRINLRAMLIEAEMIREIKVNGQTSPAFKSKNFKENIGLMVSSILKPAMLRVNKIN